VAQHSAHAAVTVAQHSAHAAVTVAQHSAHAAVTVAQHSAHAAHWCINFLVMIFPILCSITFLSE